MGFFLWIEHLKGSLFASWHQGRRAPEALRAKAQSMDILKKGGLNLGGVTLTLFHLDVLKP